MNAILARTNSFNQFFRGPTELLQPLFQLALRLYVSLAFFKAGLQKTRDWETTRFLFSYEYEVPLLSPDLAAVLGTAGELALPVLIVIGLFTRFSAAGLFVVNAVAVLSLAEIAPAALLQHHLWGLAMLVLVFTGGGKLSLDYLLKVTGSRV